MRNGLHHTVRCPRHGPQTHAQTSHRLMVRRGHHGAAAIKRRQESVRRHFCFMQLIFILKIHMVFFGRKILDQIAPQGKIHQLAAPADAEDRLSRAAKIVQERQLLLVPIPVNVAAGHILLAVQSRVAVVASGEQQPGAAGSGCEGIGYHRLHAGSSQCFDIIFKQGDSAVAVQKNTHRSAHCSTVPSLSMTSASSVEASTLCCIFRKVRVSWNRIRRSEIPS